MVDKKTLVITNASDENAFGAALFQTLFPEGFELSLLPRIEEMMTPLTEYFQLSSRPEGSRVLFLNCGEAYLESLEDEPRVDPSLNQFLTALSSMEFLGVICTDELAPLWQDALSASGWTWSELTFGPKPSAATEETQIIEAPNETVHLDARGRVQQDDESSLKGLLQRLDDGLRKLGFAQVVEFETLPEERSLEEITDRLERSLPKRLRNAFRHLVETPHQPAENRFVVQGISHVRQALERHPSGSEEERAAFLRVVQELSQWFQK